MTPQMTSTLLQVADDLWETTPDQPFPGLTTHAYLWTPPSGENVLFYSVGSERDFDQLERLGGVAHQLLSHRDEAGPMLATIGDRFGARLHAPPAEVAEVSEHRSPDVLHEPGLTGPDGIEVIATPGHSPGSTCFVVPGIDGRRYLFTGDTLYRSDDRRWTAGYIPSISEAGPLAASLDVLGALDPAPDLVISSAFAGDSGVHGVPDGVWPSWIYEARRTLP